MSDPELVGRDVRQRRLPHHRRARILPLLLVLATLAALVSAGTLVAAESPSFRQTPAPLVGRTSTTCPVAGTAEVRQATTLTAVVSRQAPGRAGALTAIPAGQTTPVLTLTEQGRGGQLTGLAAPVVLRGEGVMATASSGAVHSVLADGPEAGLMAAPCTAPGTRHWFPGVGATDSQITELVLTNPDDAQAAVDLRYYGPRGLVVVPGSPGVVIPARGTRTVALASAATAEGPLSLAVRATSGRVSAMARDVFPEGAASAGADWHAASVAPAGEVLVPGVPEGDGPRRLVVVNPGTSRAEVAISVLSVQGGFTPVGADTLTLAPESTAALDLAPGLAGQAAAVAVRSSRPVTAAVLASSLRAGAQTDTAVAAAAPALVRTGVTPVVAPPASDAELVLSNGGATDTPVSFELLNLDGVSLRSEDVLVGPQATATRRLDDAGSAYLVIRVPDDSAIVAGLVLAQLEGPVAGLSTLGVRSPDVASRAPRTVPDPAVGR